MTEKESERDPGAANEPAGPQEGAEETTEKLQLSYEGTRIPTFVVLIWLVFFVWGVIYLLRFLPESVREWFFGR